jgi:hypothetical protein
MTQTLEEPDKPVKGAGGKGKGKGKGEQTRRGPNLSALQDGLRAKTYPLPNERDAAAERTAKWHNYYNPQSPAAIHLTNECARATMVSDRLEKFRQAEIERQKANVKRNWRRRRARRLKTVVERLPEDSVAALYDLASFSLGCRQLVHSFDEAINNVARQGYLSPVALERVIAFHAIPPVDNVIHTNVTAYTFHILNLACTPGVSPDELDAWVKPASRPEPLRGLTREQIIPGDAARCRERLLEYLKLRKEEFACWEAQLQQDEDDPELRRLLDEAETLDEKASRKVNRCHAEARITFDRAFKTLCQTLERDAEEDTGSPFDDGFPDSDGFDDEDDDAETLSPWERVAEGRVSADAPPGAGPSSPPVEEAADRVQPVLPNDAEIPPDAPSQVIEAKDDSTEDQGTGGAVPSCSAGAFRDGHDDPAPEVEATTGAGVVRDGPAAADDAGGGTTTENDRGRLAASR